MKLHSIARRLGLCTSLVFLAGMTWTLAGASSPSALSGPTAVGHAEYDISSAFGEPPHCSLTFSAHTKQDGSFKGNVSFEGTALLMTGPTVVEVPYVGSFEAQVMEMLVVNETAYLYCHITHGDGDFSFLVGFAPYYPVLIRVMDNGEGATVPPDQVSAAFFDLDQSFSEYTSLGQLPPLSRVKWYLDQATQPGDGVQPLSINRGNIQVLP